VGRDVLLAVRCGLIRQLDEHLFILPGAGRGRADGLLVQQAVLVVNAR
jgi:hypothetical protein